MGCARTTHSRTTSGGMKSGRRWRGERARSKHRNIDLAERRANSYNKGSDDRFKSTKGLKSIALQYTVV